MFEMNPGWVEKFPAWKGKSLDEIKASDKITNHGGKVIQELANWMNNIDSASGTLKSQGAAHKGRSIGIEYFEVNRISINQFRPVCIQSVLD